MSFKITQKGIAVTQGDTLYIPLQFHHNITGATVRIQVRNADTDELMIDKSVTDHLSPVTGETLLKLDTADTQIPIGVYNMDMEISFLSGDKITFFPPQVGTIGRFQVTKQVTKEN